MEELLYKINKIAGREDPEEVIQNVELPSDEWIEIVDGESGNLWFFVKYSLELFFCTVDFIKSEYPELIVDIPEKSLPDSTIHNVKNKSSTQTLAQVKQRTLGNLFLIPGVFVR